MSSARRAGLEERDAGRPATPTRRVFGYLEGTPVETIWWRESSGGVVRERRLGRGSRQRSRVTDERAPRRLAGTARDYPDALTGSGSRRRRSAGRLRTRGPAHHVPPDSTLARAEWLVDGAQVSYDRLRAQPRPSADREAPVRARGTARDQAGAPDWADRGGTRRRRPRTSLRLMTQLRLETVRLAPNSPTSSAPAAGLPTGWASSTDERARPRRRQFTAAGPAVRRPRRTGRRAATGEVRDRRSCRGHSRSPHGARSRGIGRNLVLRAQPRRGRRGLEGAHADPRLARYPQRRRGRVGLRGDSTPARFTRERGLFLHPSFWPAKTRMARRERAGDLPPHGGVSFADYLHGKPETSLSMASTSGLLDLTSKSWDVELLESSG